MDTNNWETQSNIINALKRFTQNPVGGSHLVGKSRKASWRRYRLTPGVEQYRISADIIGGSISPGPGNRINKSKACSEKSKATMWQRMNAGTYGEKSSLRSLVEGLKH